MIKQLRPFYTDEELQAVYSSSYDYTRWSAHIERMTLISSMIDAFALRHHLHSVADLSCGDAGLFRLGLYPWSTQICGDLVTHSALQVVGPLEQTLPELDSVDLYVCSETLEHVQDPAHILSLIRTKASHLILSTPHAEWDSGNPEHYWGWDTDGIDELLRAAGWDPQRSRLFTPASDGYYTFQIWVAS